MSLFLSALNFCLVYDFGQSKFQESCEKTTDLVEFLSDFMSTFLKKKKCVAETCLMHHYEETVIILHHHSQINVMM